MKSVAALLLTIALALFPLSGNRALAAATAHGHGVLQADEHHGHAASHHHGSPQEHMAAHAHSHGSMDDHAPADGSKDPCGGDHASTKCCSLSCHVMASHGEIGFSAQRHVAMPVRLVALPLPHGIGFEGLLRPPRPA